MLFNKMMTQRIKVLGQPPMTSNDEFDCLIFELAHSELFQTDYIEFLQQYWRNSGDNNWTNFYSRVGTMWRTTLNLSQLQEYMPYCNSGGEAIHASYINNIKELDERFINERC